MKNVSLLAPAEALYRVLAERRQRNFLARPAAKIEHCRVVSVGNITVGGTGKTPAVQLIARLLQERDARVAIVSRGYGGTKSQAGAVVSDGAQIFCNARECGDEPLLHARVLDGVSVVIGVDKIAAARRAASQFAPDFLVLDDAFQFVSLHRDVNLVLLDAAQPLGNGHLLPRGPLRESPAALQRADAVFLTRADLISAEKLEAARVLVRQFCNAPIWECAHRAARLRSMDALAAEYSLNWLRGKKIGTLSALADNGGFRASMEKLGAQVVATIARRDHHFWRDEEIRKAAHKTKAAGGEALVCSEKDAVKISAAAIGNARVPLLSIGVELRLMRGEKELRELLEGR